ncbi:MAG TPA: hypothetical protein PLN21_05825 [Gemmatales bacterium]|nr:hypothetical protein [Gemmatales bacterium]
MDAEFVLSLYHDLQAHHLPIWIDGGWCVDALLGRQTRPHADLDLAVERRHEPLLRLKLEQWGYEMAVRENSTSWNYVMHNSEGRILDIHVFEYDADGINIYGIAYPFGSLTGTGMIGGHHVQCIRPEWMFRFKTSYAPAEKDCLDVQALAQQYAWEVPESHQESWCDNHLRGKTFS